MIPTEMCKSAFTFRPEMSTEMIVPLTKGLLFLVQRNVGNYEWSLLRFSIMGIDHSETDSFPGFLQIIVFHPRVLRTKI